MGLDMYLYRLNKTPQSVIEKIEGKHTDDFPSNILVFDAKDVEDDQNYGMFKDLLPYLTKVNSVSTFYDIDTIKKDNGIPDNARITGEGYDSGMVTFYFRWNNAEFQDGHKKVEFKSGEYEVKKEHLVCVCNYEEIFYWRKAYDVQSFIHDSYYNGEIENCGYYLLDPKTIQAMIDKEYVEDIGDDLENIFYHEWY